MFDHSHYVPVLRWKRGEREALRTLDTVDRGAMTPVIELLPGYLRPRRAKGSGPGGDDLSVVIKQIAECWGTAPIFIDTGAVGGLPYRGSATRNVEQFFTALADKGVHPIPVTRTDRATSFQSAIREVTLAVGKGVAVRIPVTSLQTPTAARELRDLVSYLGVEPASVDIIVEYGVVSDGDPSFASVCHRLPEIRRWRTLTVLGGSFPPDLMGLKKPGQYEVKRQEWKRWAAEIASSAGLLRRPSFGDFTIQHPIYYEPVKGANPSASIRYTSDTYWVIMRGEGLRNPGGTGHKQYPANAELLCERKEFCGAQFSAGDEYIWKIGSHQEDGPGTPETWLRAGINHHLTFTARQVPTVVTVSA